MRRINADGSFQAHTCSGGWGFVARDDHGREGWLHQGRREFDLVPMGALFPLAEVYELH
jgi:hypothetical protein